MSSRPPVSKKLNTDPPPEPKAPRVRYPKAVRWKKEIDYGHLLSDEERRFLSEFDAVEYGNNGAGEGPKAAARMKQSRRDQWLARTDAMNAPMKDGVNVETIGARDGNVEDTLIEAIDAKGRAAHTRIEESEEVAPVRDVDAEKIRARNRRIAATIKAGGRRWLKRA